VDGRGGTEVGGFGVRVLFNEKPQANGNRTPKQLNEINSGQVQASVFLGTDERTNWEQNTDGHRRARPNEVNQDH
jgi:hypothetical protein